MYDDVQTIRRALGEISRSLSELTSRAPAEMLPALFETGAHLLQAGQTFDRVASAVQPDCAQWQPFEICTDDEIGAPA